MAPSPAVTIMAPSLISLSASVREFGCVSLSSPRSFACPRLWLRLADICSLSTSQPAPDSLAHPTQRSLRRRLPLRLGRSAHWLPSGGRHPAGDAIKHGHQLHRRLCLWWVCGAHRDGVPVGHLVASAQTQRDVEGVSARGAGRRIERRVYRGNDACARTLESLDLVKGGTPTS